MNWPDSWEEKIYKILNSFFQQVQILRNVLKTQKKQKIELSGFLFFPKKLLR